MQPSDDTPQHSAAHQVMGCEQEVDAALHARALNQARLQGIFENTTDAILTANDQQLIVDANPAAARMFHCATSDLIGAPLERVIPARFHETHRRDVEAFGASESRARPMGRSREVVGLRADGEEFPIDASVSQLTVDGVRLYTVILRDVTRRRDNDKMLRESKAKLETALTSMNDAVLICDSTGRFVEFNDAFVSFHRFHAREDCPLTMPEYREILDVCMADGTSAPPEQWPVMRALRGEVAANVEYRLRRRDTGQHWVGSYSFAPIRSSDEKIVGSVVTGRDITEIKRVHEDLAASHLELQRLYVNQDHVQEEERRRIARELHDDLQQSLAAIRMDAVAVGEQVAASDGHVHELLARIDRLSAAAIASTRRIVSDLRPEMLEDLGLAAALQALCTQRSQRSGTDCQVQVLSGAAHAEFGDSVATNLYRITQEALNNVDKHARATAVTVTLDCTSDGLVMLRISDNGVGMNPAESNQIGHFGLRGMAERVRALGGQLRVESQLHKGTAIEALVPAVAPAAVASPGPKHEWPVGDDMSQTEQASTVAIAVGLVDAMGHPLQAVIDALPGSVVVLDQTGVIQLINRAWREFAAPTGAPDQICRGPGVNYLSVCRDSSATDPSVLPVLQGLSDVLEGRRMAYITEYPCHTPGGRQRWFRMHAASVTGGLTIISHIDLSSGIGSQDASSPQAPAP